jgi:hypothetical protein
MTTNTRALAKLPRGSTQALTHHQQLVDTMGYRCEGCDNDGGLEYGYPDTRACTCTCEARISIHTKGRLGTDAAGRRFLVLVIDRGDLSVAIVGTGELLHPSHMKEPIVWD